MLEVMLTLIMSASLAVIAAFLLLERVRRFVPMDVPGGRKKHQEATPLVGGLFIFAGLFSLILLRPFQADLLPLLVLASMTVGLGLLDDRQGLSATLRLLTHIIVGSLMAVWAGVSLTSLGSLFGGEVIGLGGLAIPVTCFAVACSMSSINMVDGVDGLAGALCLIPLVVVGTFAISHGHSALAMQTSALSGGLLVFLLFNFPFPWRSKAACFLGDTGSTLLGLMVAWFCIAGAELGLFRPVLALFLLALPLIDTAGVMLRRSLRGVSLSTPGRDHLHHVLIDSGMSHRHVTLLLTAIAVLTASIGLALEYRQLPEWVLFALFCSLLMTNLVLLRSAERAKQVIRARWFG